MAPQVARLHHLRRPPASRNSQPQSSLGQLRIVKRRGSESSSLALRATAHTGCRKPAAGEGCQRPRPSSPRVITESLAASSTVAATALKARESDGSLRQP